MGVSRGFRSGLSGLRSPSSLQVFGILAPGTATSSVPMRAAPIGLAVDVVAVLSRAHCRGGRGRGLFVVIASSSFSICANKHTISIGLGGILVGVDVAVVAVSATVVPVAMSFINLPSRSSLYSM